MERGGKESTQAFLDIGHSRAAYELMQEFCIGEVVETEVEQGLGKPEASNGIFKKNSMLWATVSSVVVAAVLFYLYMHHNK